MSNYNLAKSMSNYKLAKMNKVFIVGNLTASPTLSKTTKSQVPVVNFRIASGRKFKTSKGDAKEEVCYINVVAWLKLAEACHKFLEKGDAVFVEGELRNRNWEGQAGEKRSSIEILARRIQFLNKKLAETAEAETEDVEEAEDVDEGIPAANIITDPKKL